MRSRTVPALNIFKHALDADLPVPEQLRLVLQIAKSMLKLHATPWWKQYWSLSDLNYVEDMGGSGGLWARLRTLHVGTCLDFPSEMEQFNSHGNSIYDSAASQSFSDPGSDPDLHSRLPDCNTASAT